ncbi:MAG: type II toxin-antitoxin system RelB/DinJ family antitoxin [Bacillota bacterium]
MKTASVNVRIAPELKEQAEVVLSELGIPMSNAIALFLKQVALQRGIPFDIKLPVAKPKVMGELSEEEFDILMENGLRQHNEGKSKSAREVREMFEREYKI